MSQSGNDYDVDPHVVPAWLLSVVFAGLIALTLLTVAVATVDLGSANIWVALGVATAKAVLVVLYFMHLRWDHRFFGLVLIASLLFVALFIVITLLDSRAYAPNVEGAVGALRVLTVDSPWL